ncbi:Sugar transport protein 5 [Ananas comosus]|uniref:Sugar transport protein 5 n=1 Tax=Ananas comosus TaxID=4615 RepID=A0A199VJC5_ANACO|nr:Sugar transport protein 5 [Ananas comosus]
MDGGGFVVNGPASDYGGGLTFSMIVTCVVAASGGLIFGYDVGVSEAKRDEYCLYDSQKLTAFTSSLYIAGLAASLVAGSLTKAVGRQAILLLGGALFFAGAAVNAAAVNAAPVYLAEVSPPRWRGAFTTGFQFFLLIGVVVASVVNYATARLRRWGWRLSVGLAAAPAALLLLGALLIPDTPSSLLHRGMPDAARAALRRLRGPAADVDAELKDVARAVEDARRNEEGAFARILLQRRYRPHLVMAFAVPLFQQLTGVIVLAFFSPILFQTVGFGSNAALMGAVILAAVDLVAILVSTFTVDRYGRKVLFILGGVQMIISLVAVSWIMGSKIGGNGGATMAKPYATAVVVLLCFFSAAYGWSWGPLGWIIPSEIFPVEIRSAGQGISVAVGLGCTFVQTQTFLAMLCRFKFATFAYYAGWVTLMTVFVARFLPRPRVPSSPCGPSGRGIGTGVGSSKTIGTSWKIAPEL